MWSFQFRYAHYYDTRNKVINILSINKEQRENRVSINSTKLREKVTF